MQENELTELVARIRERRAEGQWTEAKAAREGCPEKLYDTLSSFSNQDEGGVIVFGVDEKRGYEVCGVYDAQDLQHRVGEQCKQMEPVVRAVFTVARVEGKTVVAAEIPGVEASVRPVFYRGAGRLRGARVRVGDADEPMTEAEVYAYEAFRRRLHDDLRLAEGVCTADLDEGLLGTYVERAKRERPNLASNVGREEILERMGVTRGGGPTLAGTLMFTRYPQTWYPQLCITGVVVPGTKMGETGPGGERFTDNRRFTGPLPEMVRDACDFIARNTRAATVIGKDGRRVDRAEYPARAVREAVLNAVVHRDYSFYSENTSVRIEIYADRLEITNEGGLFGRTTLEGLGRIRPDTRNAVLANILEVMRETENRYSGIPTILTECETNGLPPPRFESARGAFRVTFWPRGSGAGMVPFNRDKAEESILAYCRTPRSREELAAFAGMSRFYVMGHFVKPLVESGRLAMTRPETPKSKDQRFVASFGTEEKET